MQPITNVGPPGVFVASVACYSMCANCHAREKDTGVCAVARHTCDDDECREPDNLSQRLPVPHPHWRVWCSRRAVSDLTSRRLRVARMRTSLLTSAVEEALMRAVAREPAAALSGSDSLCTLWPQWAAGHMAAGAAFAHPRAADARAVHRPILLLSHI